MYLPGSQGPVSYTHLDVYKRQEQVKRGGIDYIALYYVNEDGKQVQILDAELA